MKLLSTIILISGQYCIHVYVYLKAKLFVRHQSIVNIHQTTNIAQEKRVFLKLKLNLKIVLAE